jgi:hypothetical protein
MFTAVGRRNLIGGRRVVTAPPVVREGLDR